MKKYALISPDKTLDYSKYSPVLGALLSTRGFVSEDEVEAFLNPNYEEHRHDPTLLNDIEKAVERLTKAIEADEKVVIYSDYDSDGIPGAVVLHDFFKAISFSNFVNYIPHRHYEGFGLNIGAVEKLAEGGVKLIITIDCGTSDVEAVKKANSLGIDVIITDHHEPPKELPPALAIVNPKLGAYPFKDLCGAAVIFKFVEAILATGKYTLNPGQEKWLLDMVGLATIADMVPLKGENRVLAHYGLKVLRKSRRPGLQQLLRKARADQRYLTEDDIGFTIGPRINAASRMDSPESAFNLLSLTDVTEAGKEVEHLEKLNNERKGQVASMTKELHGRIKKTEELSKILVFGSPDWRPSLVGLAANKLAEEHNRPVFLWGRDGNNIYKGSCRSGGGISVVKIMEATTDIFIEYGGHHFSGGFSVVADKIFNLAEALNDVFKKLGTEAEVQELHQVDAELSLEDVNRELLKHLEVLSPFGQDNPKPLFAFKGVVPDSVDMFGKGREHLKLSFTTPRGRLEAIAFFAGPNSFSKTPVELEPITLLAHVEQSRFNGSTQTRLRIVDVV